MRFASDYIWYILWAAAGFVVFCFFVFRRREKLLETFASRTLLKDLLTTLDERKVKIKNFMVATGVVLCFFSLMRPQWGFHWEKVQRHGLDIIIAFDTSKSMLAPDIKPNRLERAKLAVKDFVNHLQGDRVGLVAFAGEAFLQCPLTLDYHGFLLALDNLSVNTIPKGGTSIAAAIKEAIKSYPSEDKGHRVLILITDGEDLGGEVLKAAKEAKKEGVKIFCVGIGTQEGELIPITDEKGLRTFVKDASGSVVKTRLDEDTLKEIASLTGGGYIHAGGASLGLDELYERTISHMTKMTFKTKMVKRYEERYQIFLFLAVVLLMLEPFVPQRRSV